MGLNFEDRILIKNLYEHKGYGARKIVKEYPDKGWKIRTVSDFLKHFKDHGTIERKQGSGRPRSVRTLDNIETVGDLILSQEGAPKTHSTIRQISRKTGIHRSSVVRIVHHDLELQCFKKRRAQELTARNCQVRLHRAQELLQRFPPHQVDFIFFSDEKVFTVTAPVNLQNDRVYAPRGIKKKEIAPERLLRTHSRFSKSVMVSVAVSKLGRTDLIFVDPGVKIDGNYYRQVLLANEMLPAIRHISGDCYVFQQDSAPAHRARKTVEFLRRETPNFISPDQWPPNSPDLNPVDYKIWAFVQERVYQVPITNVTDLRQRLNEVWLNMPQDVVDNAIGEWRRRLRACVQANGQHFEQML